MNVIGANLHSLRQELKCWEAEGLRPSFWLRDDDLTRASRQLDVMSRFLDRFRLRTLLSVIPALMERTLPDTLKSCPFYLPCQHGFAHKNHEPRTLPKAEFGPARPLSEGIADISAGYALLSQAFGDRLGAIFVPPWNRITPTLASALPELGIVGLSTYAGERHGLPITGLVVCDADIDVLNWEEPNDSGVAVRPLPVLAESLTTMLRQRRKQGSPISKPIGILTHHGAMDAAAWDVVAAIVQETSERGIADWRDPATLFAHG